jgi:NAD(P)H dehydrogenase (quinone)
MKHAIIVAHPNPDSFNLTMARAYQAAAERAGCRTVLRDLYRIGFDPRLADGEVPRPEGFRPGDNVEAERAFIGGADVFVFVYPLWFNSPPAMLKGYLERVFGMGFGFGPGEVGNDPLLRGRRMISITSSGAPKDWMVETGSWAAVRNLFDEHFSAVCGLSVVDHLHFGEIVPGMTAAAVARCAVKVGEMVDRRFGPPVAPAEAAPSHAAA